MHLGISLRRLPSLYEKIAIVSLISISGCSTTPSVARTDYSLIVPSNVEAYEEQTNQRFLLGERIGPTALPTYPSGLVALRLSPQSICVEIDIDEDGKIAAARQLNDVEECRAKTNEQFLQAALAAVGQWSFHPARMCTFPNAASVNDDCSGTNVVVERVPVRLAYRFTFSVDHDGPRVRSQTFELR